MNSLKKTCSSLDTFELKTIPCFQSSLETKEYMVHELPNLLDVPQDRLCLAAALLGGTILSEQSLTDFYKRLGINQKKVSNLKSSN